MHALACTDMHTHTHPRSLIISASHSCCKLPCIAIICLHDSFQLVQRFLIVDVSDPFENLIKATDLFPGDMHIPTHTHTHTHTPSIYSSSLFTAHHPTPKGAITATHQYFQFHSSSRHTGKLHFLVDLRLVSLANEMIVEVMCVEALRACTGCAVLSVLTLPPL